MSVSISPPMFLQFFVPGTNQAAVGYQLFTYVAGTSTKQATWTDSTQTSQNSNPIVADANGIMIVWLDPTLKYKFVLAAKGDTDPPTSPLYSQDNIVGFATTQSAIGFILYPRTPAEAAASVTPTNYSFPPGDVRRYGFNGDSGITDNTSALQNAINANAGAFPVFIPNMGGYAKLVSMVTVPANTRIVLDAGAELRWTQTQLVGPIFQSSTTRPGLLIQGNNFVLNGVGKITGPSVASYTQSESAIMGFGASRTSPFIDFTVDGDIEFSQWGWGACFIQFFTKVRWNNTYVHNVGYIGIGFVSCRSITNQSNLVDTVSPGTSGNAYGITFTHDSTNYNTLPGAGTRSATNPFCISGDCSGNTVLNVSVWEGIDAHGGYGINFHDNKVYNCAIGVALAGGSGAAAGYSGEDNIIADCEVYLNQIDGTATTVATVGIGIEMKGGTTVLHNKVSCTGNTVDGYGNTTVSSYSIEMSNCTNFVCSGNKINNWEGYGIYEQGAEGIISGNEFGPIGASNTGSACIFLDTTTYTFNVTSNKHQIVSGTVAATGLRINNTNNPRCLVQGNNFSSAVAPFGGFADGLHTLGESYPIPTVTPAGTPITVALDAAASTSNPGGPVGGTGITPAPLVVVNFSGVTGPSTIDTFSGVTVGQVLRLIGGPFTTTVDRSHCALPGSASVALTANQVLQLLCVATSGTQFIAMSSITNNG
jgi:hypothetical protein